MVAADEQSRVAALTDAQQKAGALFDEVVARGLVVPGRSERALSDQIRDLAGDMFGVRRYWHKRVVRSGINTMEPYRANPPDRVIQDDDIVFFDFGPIFEEWEADFGRTYVLGDDPAKHRVSADLPRLWQDGKRHFDDHPDITGSELFGHVRGLIEHARWGHVTSHAGHLVGESPHEKIDGDEWAPTSPPGTINRCGGSMPRAGDATGSSRATWSTARGGSAGWTSSCSTSSPTSCPPATSRSPAVVSRT